MDLKEQEDLNASGQTTLTNTPQQSTDTTITTIQSTKETLEQLTFPQFQTTTLSLEDFLVRLSVLLATGQDSQILEAHYFMKSAESLGLKELNIYYLRMLKDSSVTIREIHFKPLSERWMNWGMTVNGRCLTAYFTESPKIERGLSFSGILEANPDSKYFLSPEQVATMRAHRERNEERGNGFGAIEHTKDSDYAFALRAIDGDLINQYLKVEDNNARN